MHRQTTAQQHHSLKDFFFITLIRREAKAASRSNKSPTEELPCPLLATEFTTMCRDIRHKLRATDYIVA
jgi:hypothetical protein